ncbi:hypothetical protein [Listeria costaricensis]|uniref:hypothetical protein n=1 Tax=Listeria costaricensis TaxID=2026604 RepID=UPI000C07E49F|nr:hypothetical protein [Listeria costaricensis]
MENIAKVISLDEDIEEEALVQINSVEFATFIAYSPYPIEVGKQYPVEISFFVDEANVRENTSEIKGLIRSEETFGYTVNGYLNNKGQLDVGFLIEDDIFEDYQYLYGKYVILEVDRINSEFLIQE